MRYLLDTHVWIWSVDDPERLAPSLRAIIEDEANELSLSAISFWEVLLLSERGRIGIGTDAARWIDDARRQLPLREIAIDRNIALDSRALDLPHQDPADRFIAATARVNDLVLLTHDRALLASTAVPTLGP